MSPAKMLRYTCSYRCSVLLLIEWRFIIGGRRTMQPVAVQSQAPQASTGLWPILKGGLTFGITYALPFIMFVCFATIQQLSRLQDDRTAGLIIVPLFFLCIIAGGSLLGLTAAKAVASAASRRAAIVGGITLPLAMFAGLAFAIQGESIQLGLSSHGLFTAVFPVMTAGVLLIVATILGRTLAVERAFLRTLPAAAVAWAAYMVTIFLLNKLFHWQVGTGDAAMVKIAMVGDLISATIGGALWIASLRRSV